MAARAKRRIEPVLVQTKTPHTPLKERRTLRTRSYKSYQEHNTDEEQDGSITANYGFVEDEKYEEEEEEEEEEDDEEEEEEEEEEDDGACDVASTSSDSVMGSSEITAEHLLKCVQQYERLASLRNQTTEAVVATGTRSDVSTTLPLVDSPYHIKYQWDAGTLKIISLSCKGPHGRGQSKLSGQVEAWISANKLDTIVAADVDVIRKMGDKGSAGDVAIAPLHKGEEPKSMGITFPRLIIELEVNNRGPSEMRETCASYFLDNAATPGSGAYVRAVLGIKVWVEERHACAILWMRPEGSEAAAPEVQQAWIFGVGPGISAAQQRAFEAPMEDSALPPVPRHLWQRSHVPASPFSPGSHNPRPIVRIPSATILYRVSTASRARISDIIDATKELEIDLGRVFDVCCA